MTRNREILYWQKDDSWWDYDEELKRIVLTDKAPERARKSFELMKEVLKRRAL